MRHGHSGRSLLKRVNLFRWDLRGAQLIVRTSVQATRGIFCQLLKWTDFGLGLGIGLPAFGVVRNVFATGAHFGVVAVHQRLKHAAVAAQRMLECGWCWPVQWKSYIAGFGCAPSRWGMNRHQSRNCAFIRHAALSPGKNTIVEWVEGWEYYSKTLCSYFKVNIVDPP
jgi:hypothetical protein